MGLLILRVVFVLVAAGLGVSLINTEAIQNKGVTYAWSVFGVVLLVAAVVLVVDVFVRRKRLDVISAVYFGLVVGLFLSYVFGLALSPLPMDAALRNVVQLVLAMVLCYMCISLLLQTKDDFRFIIPYVEFAKEVKGRKPYILDTSVVIDGRIADVVDARVLDGQLVIPRFVLAELQGIADSSDRMRRSRGRRGLDVLNRLRNCAHVELEINDRELPEYAGQPVDLKLVILAKHLDGKVVTNDYNLNKVARVQGVEVINLNDLANALKPVFLPGETMDVRVVKQGEGPGQGVGYLDDGTMVVIEQGRDHIGQNIHLTVTSMLQTSAGRMIFGKFGGAAEKLPQEV